MNDTPRRGLAGPSGVFLAAIRQGAVTKLEK